MAERAPLFAAAKKKLMARHHIDEAEAERAIIRGFVRLAELAGSPVDERAVTLETIHEAVESGAFVELERRAKARAPEHPTREGAEATARARATAERGGGAAPSAGTARPATKPALAPRPASAARLDPRRAVKPPRKP